MRLFAMRDEANPDASVIAVLACYGPVQEREYYIDMPEGADPWVVPLLLSSFAERGRWTIGPDWSRQWVESRVVPPSRQNIAEILRVNGLDVYDELALLQMTEGRNSQDSCYVVPLLPGEVPAWFAQREERRVREAVALEGNRLLVAFATGEARVLDAEDMAGLADADAMMRRVLGDVAAFERVRVSAGGRGVQWGTVVHIADEDLRHAGTPVALSWPDVARLGSALVVDTSEAAHLLGCTRQNINQLVRRGSLVPVKTGEKVTLFLRSDIRRRLDQQ